MQQASQTSKAFDLIISFGGLSLQLRQKAVYLKQYNFVETSSQSESNGLGSY